MYTLYYLPGACSLGIHTLLRELRQEFDLVDRRQVKNFEAISPVGAVPVLIDEDQIICEGAAIVLHLLAKHQNAMLPQSGIEKSRAVKDLMFANATMHPAYGRLYFLAQTISNEPARQQGFNAAAATINRLWSVVNAWLDDRPFLGGDQPSVADILLSVYSRWGAQFPVEIHFGERVERMIATIIARESFQQALAVEDLAAMKPKT